MKKIGIMTLYYQNHNYGGQLQAYALCRYLNKHTNFKCEQIAFDYKRKRKKTCKQILFRLYSYLFHPTAMIGLYKRMKKFQSFESQVPHSQVVRENDVSEVAQQYDYVIVGSDQVWNFDYSSKQFLLEFLPPSKRCSYGASFGKDFLEQYQMDDVIQVLKTFSFLSVREETAKIFLQNNGIEQVKMVCDPTLLVTRKEWQSSIDQISKKVKGKYVFVYLLSADRKIREELKTTAHKYGLKIVFLPHIHFSYQKHDKNFADIELYEVGPWEFLRLIYDATIIVTDSFHCSLFAILFHKDFWTLPREKTGMMTTNGRMHTLLEKAQLKDRFVDSVKKIEWEKSIEYTVTDYNLENYVQQSEQMLQYFLREKM